MVQKVDETESRRAADDQVRGIADKRRHSAYVRGQHLGEEKRNRTDLKTRSEKYRDGADKHNGRDIVEYGRCDGGQNQQDGHQPYRLAPGPFGGLDGQPLKHSRSPHRARDNHHSKEQENDVPVDVLERRLLGYKPEDQHYGGAGKRGDSLVNAL